MSSFNLFLFAVYLIHFYCNIHSADDLSDDAGLISSRPFMPLEIIDEIDENEAAESDAESVQSDATVRVLPRMC